MGCSMLYAGRMCQFLYCCCADGLVYWHIYVSWAVVCYMRVQCVSFWTVVVLGSCGAATHTSVSVGQACTLQATIRATILPLGAPHTSPLSQYSWTMLEEPSALHSSSPYVSHQGICVLHHLQMADTGQGRTKIALDVCFMQQLWCHVACVQALFRTLGWMACLLGNISRV